MADELVRVGPFRVERNLMWTLPAGGIVLGVTMLVYAYLVYQRFASSGLSCGSAWQMEVATAEASAAGAALLAVTLSTKRPVQVLLAVLTLAIGGWLGYDVTRFLYAPQCGY